MIDILLISDQPRLHSILNRVGTLPDGTVRIATGLSHGLMEIGSRAPDLLFLQNRLSGLSGSILVRHVRSESGSSSIKIILFTDSTEESGESTADIELSVAVSDNELSDAIIEIIGDQLGDHDLHPGIQSTATKLDSDQISPATTALSTGLGDTVSISTGAPQSEQTVNASLGTAHPPTAKQELKDDNIPRQATILNSSPPPIQWEKKRLMIALSVILFLSVSGLLFAVFTGKPSPAVPRTVAPAPKTRLEAVQKPATTHPTATGQGSTPVYPLPKFIPPGNHDPRYASSNPGWERYTTASKEFKIYRDAGSIKALQVIDRRSSGIAPSFFSSALQEMAKVRDYRLESRELKEEFLVKKGKLSSTAQIILYKNRADTVLHAFVIYFEKEASTQVRKELK